MKGDFMPEMRTCNDGHGWVAFISLKCPVCEEIEKVIIELQDLRERVEKVELLVNYIT